MRCVLTGYKNSAAERGYGFLLTENQFQNLATSACHYCGGLPSNVEKRPHGETFIYNGIDRVNNEVGYIDGNCVPCCWTCNRLKRDLSREKFLSAVSSIYKHSIGETQ